MPRRSSGGRSAARGPPHSTPMTKAPAPVQSGGRSFLGEIASTIAEGMAFSTGAEMARRAVDAIVGPLITVQHETVVYIDTDGVANSCSNHCKAFQDCINGYGSDISKCQFYLDRLNECCKRSAAVL